MHDVVRSLTATLEARSLPSVMGSAFYRAVSIVGLECAYWDVAPAVHRYRRYLSPHCVDPPTDPFELFAVDPDRIVRFTGREFPVWTSRWTDFGTVVDGDWDQRERPPIHPSHTKPDPSLYLADRFDETPLHRALERHFSEGVPWEETAFVREIVRQAGDEESGDVWYDCSTVSAIERRCHRLDGLYEAIRDRGFLSMRELNARDGRRMPFREVMENEILVDMARDGSPLFVTGRHRLSIAKIIGLEKVPVAIVVRHPHWVRCRERICDVSARHSDASRSGHDLGNPFRFPW